MKVLVLNDRFESRGRLFNLGDRALQDGFRRILENYRNIEIISSQWKAFPYLTFDRYQKQFKDSGQPSVFSQWSGRALADWDGRSAPQRLLTQIMNSGIVCHNPIQKRIDRITQYHTSLGLVEAVRPYVLRKHFSHRLISQIHDAQLVLFNGAGLVSDHLAKYLPGWLWELFLAMELGRPVVACNLTMGLTKPDLLSMALEVFCHVKEFLVREPESAERLHDLGLPGERIITSVDSAFAANISVDSPPSEIAKTYGVDHRTAILVLRGDRTFQPDAIREMIIAIRSHGLDPLFIFTCDAQDRPLYRAIGGDKTVRGLKEMVDYPLVVAMMSKAALVVTDRYHAAIFSALAGTPFVPMPSSTLKMHGLVRLLQYPLPVLPPLEKVSIDQYADAVRTLVAEREARSVELKSSVDRIRNKLFSDYREMIARVSA